ncbi:MAG TPA: alkylhydroperoxidase-related (seleno)protein [Ilumatobacteraceae bacterium]
MTAIDESAVRPDLTAAHRQAWDSLGTPGTWWNGHQRVELAATAVAALTVDEPLPPWTAPSTVDGVLPANPAAPLIAHDAMYRIATHAGTITEPWFERVSGELGDLAYVELVAIACTVAAVTTFRGAAGLPRWELPEPADGEPSRVVPPDLVPAGLNWVRVTSPADAIAAVVQAFTSVPAENERLWTLAAAQYIPNTEMVDPHWTRGSLSRPQMELVAARISQLRECFY